MIIRIERKPLSYNQYFRNSKTGKRIKTGAGLEYDEYLDYMLEEMSEELIAFGKTVDTRTHRVRTTMLWLNPDYMLKDGSRISKTGGDEDNILKVIQDKVSKAMRLDDSCFKGLFLTSLPSDKHLVRIDYSIGTIPDFCPSGL